MDRAFLVYGIMPFLGLLIASLFIVYGCIGTYQESVSKKAEKELERQKDLSDKIQTVFTELSIGTECSVAMAKLKSCEGISEPHLVSEVQLENGINKKVYTWHLSWDTVVGSSQRYDNRYKYNYYEKGFIKMVFENDRLVSKEEHGLY